MADVVIENYIFVMNIYYILSLYKFGVQPQSCMFACTPYTDRYYNWEHALSNKCARFSANICLIKSQYKNPKYKQVKVAPK